MGNCIITRADSLNVSGKVATITLTSLWTNSSPSSNFSAQTISVNSSAYSMLCIACINSKNATDYPVPFFITKGSVHWGLSVNSYGRGVYATDTSVVFVDANTTAIDRCIPTKIYGVKWTIS